ncbi:hypothetical protein [Flavobacterium branchiophilum]|nr:hypothetical protein [Flavobacterium branchiophilum]
MKNYLYLILFLISTIMNGQELSNKIEKSTLEYRKLFLEKNFEKLCDYATPKLIEQLKTKQDLIFLLTELNENAESKGAKVTNITFGKTSEIIEYKNQLQCSIPFSLEMEDEKKKVTISAGLALISFDKGKTWLFTFKVEKEQEINNAVLDLDNRIMIAERNQNVINK